MLHINRIIPQALTFMVTCLLAVSQALAIDDIGASYQFRHFDKAQGLSNLSVSCILEDRNGFIWVGTTNGLNRFDGVRYKNYFADQNKPGKLPSNVIYALAESRDGSIWVSTYNHLAVYNPEKDTFTTFKPKGVEFTDIVFDLVFDRQGNLWAYDSKNTYCISPKEGTCKTFSTDKYFAPLQINVLTDGQVWITATDGNAYKYNPGANKFTRYPILTEEESEQCQLTCRILEYDNGELLMPTNRKGARLFNPKTGEVRTLFTTAGDNEQIYIHSSLKRQTEDGSEYWFGTEDGIYIYSQKKGWTHHLHKSYSNPTGLTDNAIHHLYTDRNSGIWVGTFFGGVNYLPAAGSTIFRQIMPLNANGTTAANVTRELVSDTEGNLWVGTEDGGLFVLDKNGNGTIVAAQPSCDGKRIPKTSRHCAAMATTCG